MTDFAAIRTLLPPLETIIRGCGITLSKQGTRLFAHCPFHEDSTPSFSIFPDGERCGCPPCQWDGDAFEFIQQFYELPDAAAAAKFLCDRYGVAMPNGTATRLKRPDVRRTAEPATPKRKTRRGPYVEHDDYVDAFGAPLYRVTRYGMVYEDGSPAPGKTFSQGRIHAGILYPNMDGVEYVLYNLPSVLAAATVWLCEGERDARAVIAAGACGTTDAGGAGARDKFAERGYPEQLRGKDVLIVPDTDKPGRERGAAIAAALHGIASSVRIVLLPDPCKDIRDYLEAGGALADLAAAAVEFTATAEPEPKPETADTVATDAAMNWRELLLVDRSLNPRPVIANVLTVLRQAPEWAGVLWYNEFSQDTVARKPFPSQESLSCETIWTDRHDALFLEWLNHHGICCTIETVGRAVQTIAEERKFHPVREYLHSIQWDGEPRIDTWLQHYCGVKHTPYVSAVGSRWLISAVARVFEPGCKADCALILEGDQGAGKSTTLSILGGRWFTDEIADLGSREAAIQTNGAWIVEISELDSMKRVDVGKVKAFISLRTHRYRPPYGKRAQEFPRQCVFGGTVNHGTYLQDETGNRRFWPVTCGRIDMDALAADRDQLWAEAVIRFRDKHPWWLDTPALIAEAEIEQRARYESDPWEEIVAKWIDGRRDVSISDVLSSCITKPTGQWSQLDKVRMSRVLTSLGWTRHNLRTDAGNREWRYTPPRTVRQDEIPW